MKRTQKPEITLILSSSVDGRLIGRDSEDLDSNKSWKKSKTIRGIVQQFFDFSPNNKDIFNLVTSSTIIRLGVENPAFIPKKEKLKLVVIDETNEINPRGIRNLALSVEELIIVTNRKSKLTGKYPKSCHFLHYNKKINLVDLVKKLGKKYMVKKLTIQSSGFLNSRWIETGLVNFLTVIFYPVLVGNNGTPTLIEPNIFTARPVRLISTSTFDTNYLLLRYKVIN